ncbi:MAG: hypothetical protein A2148_09965 [Chloroflexi bacterium RBG_16_68_14]|nr:MAG: hypothetical protein A2148_09965 [Chloroflexi bacterium RBG_16_68_14]
MELMRQTLARYQAWLVLALTSIVCLAGAWAISLALPPSGRDEFNFVRWEMRHLPGKWLYLTGRFFAGGLSPEEQDRRLGRFLVLSARIRRLEHSVSSENPAQLEELSRLFRERAALENDAEAIIEGRLTAVLEEADLESSIPLFPAARWVFPPVDVEFDHPPNVLAVSLRDRIELVEQRPLRAGLSLEEIRQVEARIEWEGTRSALVDDVGGVAAYPSIVAPRGDYEVLVEAVGHEWAHQYLFFRPLGRRYFSNLELRTLNETVADLAGRELAALTVRRFPLPQDVASQLSALLPGESPVDVDTVLRQLRLDVEALLTDGEIEAAEALMEQRRQELAAQGVVFRRINQAFFAFRSLYAGDPASIDPIGGKVEALRRRTGSIGDFLRQAARLTSEAHLDGLLAGGTRAAGGRARR